MYGKEKVCHIGTYTQEGVKSGLKDVARVFRISFQESNEISKKIDEISDNASIPPQPSFSDFDRLKESPSEFEREQWKEFDKLEKKYSKLFDLARKFEGCKRNFGIHASAYLAMPIPISNVFPTRRDSKTGVTVTLYPGTTIEELGGVKFDLLGLKSLDIISDTLKNINEDFKINDLYEVADITDQNVYSMLSNADSDCVFQFESGLFKNMLRKIQPRSIEDLSAITALGRPGPLAIGFNDMYADAKNNGIEPPEYLHGIQNITQSTYHVYVYQEQLMSISKQVAGFDVSQADSLMRKAIAKKKVKMFPMIRRCLIYGKKNCEGPDGWEENDNLPWYDPKKKYGAEIPGALVNGYTAEEMDTFWKSILGFASYAFNASHSVAYAYISYLMAWLKYYYPTQFFTAVLTMTSDDEKRKNYIRLAEDFADTKTLPPDINKSNEGFTCDAEHKTIYYGLASIKGVGATSYKTIIANRPYTSLQDIFDKVPKKAFNKSVGIALIKSGALDSFNPNRLELLKEFYKIRKDKVEDFDTSAYNDDMSITMERETLGINLSHKTWWESIPRNKKIEVDTAFVTNIREHTDKRGRLMAFLELSIEGCPVNAIVFASTYSRYQAAFKNIYGRLSLVGKKDDKDELIIDKASLAQSA